MVRRICIGSTEAATSCQQARSLLSGDHAPQARQLMSRVLTVLAASCAAAKGPRCRQLRPWLWTWASKQPLGDSRAGTGFLDTCAASAQLSEVMGKQCVVQPAVLLASHCNTRQEEGHTVMTLGGSRHWRVLPLPDQCC